MLTISSLNRNVFKLHFIRSDYWTTYAILLNRASFSEPCRYKATMYAGVKKDFKGRADRKTPLKCSITRSGMAERRT